MTVVLAEPRHQARRGTPRFSLKLAVAAALAVIADWLFWDRPIGISLALFLGLIALSVCAVAVPRTRLPRLGWALAAFAAALAPLAENVSVLSAAIGLAATAGLALAASGRLRSGVARIARQIAGFLVAASFRFVPDMVRWRKVAKQLGGGTRLAWLAVWVLPLGLGGVFIVLFGVANPVVEMWLEQIDLWAFLELFQVPRIAFWLLVLMSVWGFLRPRISWFQRPGAFRRRRAVAPTLPAMPTTTPAEPFGAVIFGEAAILRALIVFNGLFAVETVLDIAYLWGGVALPEGLTYAAYAHRGAYPLIITALLAAAFVLAATRERSRVADNPLIRALIYLWTAQNVMLVISSMLRLDLYVSIYSLTYWRVAAFIWMALVAAGLVLIIVRIALGKSSDWLLSANLLTLSATLYACGFVNFAAVIATYNVDHRPQPGNTIVQLDTWYLGELGPQAIPAIDRLLAAGRNSIGPAFDCLVRTRMRLASEHAERMAEWRGFMFRGWRLRRYLDGHVPAAVYEWHDGVRER